MRRDRDPMRSWLLCLQNDVASNLMDLVVFPILAEVLHRVFTA
jgi:hypothetical protein